ncbi:hypothetical protein ACWDAZ_35790, partial [Streptomyces sp. NPDC001215]
VPVSRSHTVSLAVVHAPSRAVLHGAAPRKSTADGVAWSPLTGHPLVRRTWAVWPADSRRQDLGRLVAAFEQPPGD